MTITRVKIDSEKVYEKIKWIESNCNKFFQEGDLDDLTYIDKIEIEEMLLIFIPWTSHKLIRKLKEGVVLPKGVCQFSYPYLSEVSSDNCMEDFFYYNDIYESLMEAKDLIATAIKHKDLNLHYFTDKQSEALVYFEMIEGEL